MAVVGSGPAGLAAADQLNRAGHSVTVFEKSDRIGGLLRYGIPEFKMEKRVLDRRLAVLEAEGVAFKASVNVGGADMPAARLRAEFDAVLLAAGAGQPRDLPVPGRELTGIHFAMEYLTLQNKRCEGDVIPDDAFITAHGKHVIIIGGGDTGADCLGTAHRQGAKSVTQLELLPRPPAERAPDNPWPQWPNMFRVSTGARRGRRAPVRGVHAAFHRRRCGPRPHTARGEGGNGAQGRPRRSSNRCRAASSRFPPISCCWRWGSSGRSAVRSSTTSG